MNLLEPTQKYINYIEHSKHYLNCPKCMFNSDLDSMYRQGCMNETSVDKVAWLLKYYNYPNPTKTATEFVEQRNKISLKEFDTLNVNSYIQRTPEHIVVQHKQISHWFATHNKTQHTIFGSYTPQNDYPHFINH